MALRICLVTRGDVFPANHGAAVRIVRFAEYSSLLGATVCLVSEDRDAYWRWRGGMVERVAYGPRFRAFEEWPGMGRAGRIAERLCGKVGYPPEEHFLYRAQFDPAWWARVLYVGLVEDIEVFQAEFPGYALAAAAAARTFDARSSLVQHNVEFDRLKDVAAVGGRALDRIRELELAAIRAVDDVVAVSEDDRRRMVEAGADAAKITVIPHGVDLAAYRPGSGRAMRYALGVPEDRPLLFFHGTLHYWPNTQAVGFIAEQLLPRLPGVEVAIAGLNPPEYYRHPSIHFLGPIPDLPRAIDMADLCICPVFSGGGTRMKLLEYMAAGKPTVSATKGAEGIRFRDGVEMALADDADSFARECRRLLDDRPAAEAMGAAARRFAARYDWSAVARRTIALYEGRGRGGDFNAEAPDQGPVLAVPRAVAPAEAHLPPREPSKPLTLLFLVNRGCNLKCVFCDLHDRPEQVPVARALALMDEAAAIGTRTVVLTGGEPLLHHDLPRIAARARELGMSVNVTTNGLLVERRMEELRGVVHSLSMSLDGLRDVHDGLRGQRGAFDKTLRALELARGAGFATSVYFTAGARNVHQLTEVYELARGLGAGFDFWPVNDAPELYLRSPEHQAAFRAAVEHIAARDASVAARRHFYEEGLRYHAGRGGPVRCLGLVDQYGVTYEGHLLPCCVWGAPGLRVGNVFETPLSELWRSPEVQRFRTDLYGSGCSAGCFNHSLYEFTRSTGESFRVTP